MLMLIALVIAFVPSVLWVLFLRWWDRKEAEPPSLLVSLFFSGVIAGAVVWLLRTGVEVVTVSSHVLPPLDALSLDDGLLPMVGALVLVSALQQLVSFALLRHMTTHESAFTQGVDGIVYAITLASGIAFIQNLATITHVFSTGGGITAAQFSSLWFQLIFVTLALVASTGYVGLGYGLARLDAKSTAERHALSWPIVRGLLEAVLIQSVFQMLVLVGELRLAGAVALMAAVYLLSRFALEEMTRTLARAS